MPLNVSDASGNHLGYLIETFSGKGHIFKVLLTETRIDNLNINLENINNYLASVYGAKKRRNIDIYRLLNELNLKYGDAVPRDREEELLRFAFVKTVLERKDLKKFKILEVPVDKNNALGYILLDLNKARWKGSCLILEQKLDYVPPEKACDGLPLYARIIDYPVFKTDVMTLGEGLLLGADITDYFGRNHAHTSRFKIFSGNVEEEITLPVHINAAKGMDIQLYYVYQEIVRVFCGNAIYEWRDKQEEEPLLNADTEAMAKLNIKGL